MYKRIAGAADQAALRDLQVECIDRFGLLPEPLKNLFRSAELKQTARALGVSKIELGEKGGRVAFREGASVDPERGPSNWSWGGRICINWARGVIH